MSLLLPIEPRRLIAWARFTTTAKKHLQVHSAGRPRTLQDNLRARRRKLLKNPGSNAGMVHDKLQPLAYRKQLGKFLTERLDMCSCKAARGCVSREPEERAVVESSRKR